jgi:hypothetical protein
LRHDVDEREVEDVLARPWKIAPAAMVRESPWGKRTPDDICA